MSTNSRNSVVSSHYRPCSMTTHTDDYAGSTGVQILIQEEEEGDLRDLQEREEAVRRLETDIVGINQIFTDLAVLVNVQGETIDNIDKHVSDAVDNVEEGGQQLEKAVNYQTSARNKKFCCIGFLLLVLVILGLVLYFTLKDDEQPTKPTTTVTPMVGNYYNAIQWK